MIMLAPIIYVFFNPCNLTYKLYFLIFILNWIIHFIVDNCKANIKNIDLEQDQSIHIIQIIITWVISIYVK